MTLKEEYELVHAKWVQEIKDNEGVVDLKSPKNPGYWVMGQLWGEAFDRCIFESLVRTNNEKRQ